MFENVHVADSFKNSITTALLSGRLSHAVILEGAKENTALSVAKEIATYLQCSSKNKPCGVCSNCIKNRNGSHPDVYVLEKEPDSTMIKVKAIRELKKRATVLPNDSAKSVFIISGAEYMNEQAQNALLKIFEEPAGHVCFILTCESKSALLETIISRATSYYLGEHKTDSISKTDNKASELATELLGIYVAESEFDFLKATAVFQKEKKLFKNVIEAMIPIVRDALVLRSGGKTMLSDETDIPQKIQTVLTQSKIIKLIEQLQLLSEQLSNSANHNLIITRFCSVLYSIKTHR